MSKVSLDLEKEEALVKRAQSENTKASQEAFGILYEHYQPHILKFFRQRLRNDYLAEDFTSEVFEKALKALDSFQWQGVSFSAWLYKIARNLLIDHIRTQQKRVKKIHLDEVEHFAESSLSLPEDELYQVEAEEQLNRLLETLSKRERKIVYMKFFEGYTNRSIAEKLDLSETNVGTILHRVIGKLRKKIL